MLRLTIRAVDGGGPGVGVAIADLEIPGVEPERTLAVPDIGAPALLRFAVAPGYRSDCLAVPIGVVCDPVSGAPRARSRLRWIARSR